MRRMSAVARPTCWIVSGCGPCIVTDCCQLRLTGPRDCHSAQLLKTPSNVDRICGRAYPAHAKSDDADETAAPTRHCRHYRPNEDEDHSGDCRWERNCKKLASLRHERTYANEATIEKALEGDYRTEHLFALKQSLEAFDHYQKLIAECDHR